MFSFIFPGNTLFTSTSFMWSSAKVYDKTSLIGQLIAKRKRTFMSWPPNFGKNHIFNTIREIFRGNKALFVGTDIYNSSYAWISYPVLDFDFYRIATGTRDVRDFECNLNHRLQELLSMYRISTEERHDTKGLRLLTYLVTTLYEYNRTESVVLVDEYDFPIIRFHRKRAEKNHMLLNHFFKSLKSLGKYIRFLLVTGVSLIHLDWNGIEDISLDPEYIRLF